MLQVMRRLNHKGTIREFFTKQKEDPSLSKATKVMFVINTHTNLA